MFLRSGELRPAEWSEIDFDNAEWRIPAERMKMRDPHYVPLACSGSCHISKDSTADRFRTPRISIASDKHAPDFGRHIERRSSQGWFHQRGNDRPRLSNRRTRTISTGSRRAARSYRYGKPCVRGMRLTVRRVVEAAALYPDRNELKAKYPELTDEDIAQALDFAARSLDDQIFPLEAA